MASIKRTVTDMTPDKHQEGLTMHRRVILKSVDNPPYQFQSTVISIVANHVTTSNGQKARYGEIKITVVPVHDSNSTSYKNSSVSLRFDQLEEMWAEYQAWKAEVPMSVDETAELL